MAAFFERKHRTYALLDIIRGFALLNMLAYHAVWDLVYLFGFDWKWYQSDAAFLWQQSICCTFIFLSGFCLPLGRQPLKRGLQVFGCGLLISAVTVLVMPQSQILFGVLTSISSSMILCSLLRPLFARCPSTAGGFLCLTLFFFTKHLTQGFLGFSENLSIPLPKQWYCSLFTAFLGLPAADFFSTDYFPLFPWFFLFAAGVFFYQICENCHLLTWLKKGRFFPLEWAGQHSLGIYLLHQPVIYLLLSLLF